MPLDAPVTTAKGISVWSFISLLSSRGRACNATGRSTRRRGGRGVQEAFPGRGRGRLGESRVARLTISGAQCRSERRDEALDVALVVVEIGRDADRVAADAHVDASRRETIGEAGGKSAGELHAEHVTHALLLVGHDAAERADVTRD